MRIVISCAALVLCVATPLPVMSAGAGTNVLVNGSFDDPGNPLQGWVTDYTWSGNEWYSSNHLFVAVIPRDGARTNVLKLSGTRATPDGGKAEVEEVKVDSEPIPYDPAATYRISAYARIAAAGARGKPTCRILIEGYGWKPGIKPHAKPALQDLRKMYRQGSGNIMYFGDAKDGHDSMISSEWQRGACVFGGAELSESARRTLKNVPFICVHIVLIDGGVLLLDDVAVTRERREH